MILAGVGRARGRGPGGAVAAILASVAVAALVTVLATHRDAAEANPNSAVIATVPPLAGASAPDVSVTGLPTTDDAGDSGPDLGWLDDGDAPTAAWPTPPDDPAPAVDAAIARAADDGVRVAAVVLDRASGTVLVSRDADVSYPSLSLLKIMIAADVLTNGWPDAAADATRAAALPESADASVADQSAEDVPLPAPEDPVQLHAVLTRMIATSDDAVAGDLYGAAGGDELVDRVALRYGLTGTNPTPDGTYWGNVQVTAADMATLLAGGVGRPADRPGDRARDAGSPPRSPPMGWTSGSACDWCPAPDPSRDGGAACRGEVGLHSIGFTDDRIVVVLTGADPGTIDGPRATRTGWPLQADPRCPGRLRRGGRDGPRGVGWARPGNVRWMPTALTAETIVTAPKVLLHDHLDGGLRPATLVDLAEPDRLRELPADTAGRDWPAGSPSPPTRARWSGIWRPSPTPSPSCRPVNP